MTPVCRCFGYRSKSWMTLLQAGAAQDLLADRLQAIFDARGDGRLDVRFRHTLRHDENQRLGPVPVRQERRADRGQAGDDDKRDHNPPFAPPRHARGDLRDDIVCRESRIAPLTNERQPARDADSDRLTIELRRQAERHLDAGVKPIPVIGGTA